MSKLAELIKQREELDAKIVAEAKEGRAAAVAQVRELIKQYKITATDLKGLLKTRRTKAQIEADNAKKATKSAKAANK